jgi:adenine/guanine/hypoxanthine permease
MGAGIGYSWLNGVVMGAACLLGLLGVVGQLDPIEAGIAIVLYIGLVIAAQAFQATPPRHAPAVALGLLWQRQAANPFGPAMLAPLAQADGWAAGAFALEQGQIITAMLLAAAACAAIAAVLSWFGVIHAWQFTSSDTVLQLGWGVGQSWALGYGLMAMVFLAARWGLRPQR